MLGLIRYLKGYVTIRVWGFSPERFMNLCGNHCLFLWNIVNHDDYYTMCINIRDFYRLKTITRKTGTRVVIKKRCGLPFLVPKMKKRKIFLLGLLGSVVFWIWMSGYIWAIELEGNFHVTGDELMGFLAAQEIKIGIKRGAVDIEELEKALRREYGIITWTSARIDGTRLAIRIKENELAEIPPKAPAEDGVGYDLVAEKDGTVVSIITRRGIPLVAEGSEVKVGEVLVEGCVPIFNDDATVRRYQYCRADADIYLRCLYESRESLPVWYEEKQYSGAEKKAFFIEAGGRRMRFFPYQNPYETADTVEELRQVKLLDNFYLPVYYGTERMREYTVVTKSCTREEAKSIFAEEISKIMKTLMEKGVQIIEKNVTIKKDSFHWYLDLRFDIIEKTGKMKPTGVPSADGSEELPDEGQSGQ